MNQRWSVELEQLVSLGVAHSFLKVGAVLLNIAEAVSLPPIVELQDSYGGPDTP